MIRLLQRDSVVLAILIILGTLLRLDFLLPVNFVIDADEAIVGLMAKHISEGQPIPTFYYGQHYMGSLEPLLASYVFSIFGISSLTLKIVPLVFSLLLIVLVYFIGKELGSNRIGLVAALLCAIPPTSLVVWSAKARGGFIELLVIGAAALLIALHWLKPGGIRYWRTFLVGLLLGLGWWVNNQIIFFILPIGFCFFARLLWLEKINFIRRVFLIGRHALLGLLAFLLGGLPFWIYNLRNNFVSFEMFHSAQKEDFAKHIAGLFSTSIPIIIGAKRFWEFEDFFPNSSYYYYGIYILLFSLIVAVSIRKLAGLFVLKVGADSGIELLLLFIFSCLAVFSLSSFGYLVHAPRYLLPIYVALFPLLAFAIDRVHHYSKSLAIFLVLTLLGLNIASSYACGRALPGEPFVFNQQRVSKDHDELISWLRNNKITWVRTNYWIGYRLAFETKEEVKFDLFQDPAQVRIDSYRNDAIKFGEEKMPFVLVPAQAELVKQGLKTLNYQFKEAEASGYKIIYDIKPLFDDYKIIDLAHSDNKPTDPSVLSVTSNYNAEQAWKAIDNDPHTRWGSAHPQSKDMRFTINLKSPLMISGVHYELGSWPQDWPRGLRIEIVDPNGQHKVVFNDERYTSIRFLTGNNQALTVYFEPHLASQVILYQEGQDPVFDWSIAEVDLYQVGS